MRRVAAGLAIAAIAGLTGAAIVATNDGPTTAISPTSQVTVTVTPPTVVTTKTVRVNVPGPTKTVTVTKVKTKTVVKTKVKVKYIKVRVPAAKPKAKPELKVGVTGSDQAGYWETFANGGRAYTPTLSVLIAECKGEDNEADCIRAARNETDRLRNASKGN